MSTVKQLLRLHKQQKGKKTIANILGISKNTVKSYLQKAEADELSLDALLNLEDPVLEARLHAGSPAYKDPRYEELKSRLDHYAKELKRVGVTRQLLYEEYKEGISKAYSYTQFCYHLKQYLKRTNPSMVLTHKPADKLFVDFAGKKLHYINRQTGELIACEVFIGCLPYSDYSFALAVPSQKVSDFIHALNCCLQAIGGVPQSIVPDNLKSAVIKSSKYEPRINRVLEDFANHYQTTIVPARARKPKDKALVENQVKLIYNRVYAKLRDQKFFDLESLNAALLEKVRQHNQTRRQLKDWCREEQFIAEEQSKLSSLPENIFEIKHYKTYKVAANNHIFLGEDKHYYSVPYQYIGQQVHLIYTKRLVQIHSEGKCIATHPRERGKGKYTTAKAHLCSTHQYYLKRSPMYYKKAAQKVSSPFYQLVKEIFEQNRYPEQLYKSCDGLLALSRQTDQSIFNKACEKALCYHQFNYSFVKNVIENRMIKREAEDQTGPPPKHQNVRGNVFK